MSKKKRRRQAARPSPPSGTAREGTKPRSRRTPAAPRSDRRRLLTRAAIVILAVGLTYVLLLRTRSPGAVSAAALADARAAGCGTITHPAANAPGGIHLQPGESFTYSQHPATSGPHDPSPLPPDPHVYEEPVPETRAVHNLEHAYVLIYYRASADGGLAAETVDALEGLARDTTRVIMAPYPDLPPGTALALAAWNTLWECPAEVTTTQATTIARGFVDAFAGTSIAPEPPRGLLGPLVQK